MIRDLWNAPFAVMTAAALVMAPALALAQASPFMTGATALQTNILAWLTPIARATLLASSATFGGKGAESFRSLHPGSPNSPPKVRRAMAISMTNRARIWRSPSMNQLSAPSR